MSGTPHGLISDASAADQLVLLAEIGEAHSNQIIVEYPVSPEFTRRRGYARFVEFRAPGITVAAFGRSARAYRYALIRSATMVDHRVDNPSTQATKCGGCGYAGAIEFGRCAICGADRMGGHSDERVKITEPVPEIPLEGAWCGTSVLIAAEKRKRLRDE